MNSSSSSIPISTIDIDEDTSPRTSPTAPSQRLPVIANVVDLSGQMASSDGELVDIAPSTPTARSRLISVRDDSVWSAIVPLNDLTASPDETLGRIRSQQDVPIQLPPHQPKPGPASPPKTSIEDAPRQEIKMSKWRDPYGFYAIEAYLRVRQPRPASPTSSTSSIVVWRTTSPALSERSDSPEGIPAEPVIEPSERMPTHAAVRTKSGGAWRGGQMLARILDPKHGERVSAKADDSVGGGKQRKRQDGGRNVQRKEAGDRKPKRRADRLAEERIGRKSVSADRF